MIIIIIMVFFLGLSVGSLRLRVQTIEESIEQNNPWGQLEQLQKASLEALKQVNRIKRSAN